MPVIEGQLLLFKCVIGYKSNRRDSQQKKVQMFVMVHEIHLFNTIQLATY